ncbi:hypothetical protein CHS0354_033256 [Potamilus streckersoni]|uniref:Uncharacterized protein n=1 Tax=Potamilus streckersoni TaxID=2493646 RepID=A0AAE0S674_9BIVA|nr:hypothetical protein CHS0354_033256 [Potamilus streckersoni]
MNQPKRPSSRSMQGIKMVQKFTVKQKASASLKNLKFGVNHVSLPSCPARVSHPAEENHMKGGSNLQGMALYPPAMINMTEVEEKSVALKRMLKWSPWKWSTMMADAKLMLWEVTALTLEKEMNLEGNSIEIPC